MVAEFKIEHIFNNTGSRLGAKVYGLELGITMNKKLLDLIRMLYFCCSVVLFAFSLSIFYSFLRIDPV